MSDTETGNKPDSSIVSAMLIGGMALFFAVFAHYRIDTAEPSVGDIILLDLMAAARCHQKCDGAAAEYDRQTKQCTCNPTEPQKMKEHIEEGLRRLVPVEPEGLQPADGGI